ncbi:MAG: hypothetical protein ACYC2Y_11055 [Armatimonadota bacterium]
MPVADKEMTRMVQREIGRHPIDSRLLDVHCSHGVVHVRGILRRLRGHDVDLRHELEMIRRVLHSKPGVRDVHVDDVVIRG